MKKKLLASAVLLVLMTSIIILSACSSFNPKLPYYDMNIYDLSTMPNNTPPENFKDNCLDGASCTHDYMFKNYDVAVPTEEVNIFGDNREYLGHPDSVLLDDEDGTILTAFPIGHGRGETLIYESKDKGIHWKQADTNPLPTTFKETQETPTFYKLDFTNGDQKLLLASGRPGWGKKGEGFDVAISTSKDANGKCNGKVWQPHKNYFSEHATEEQYKAPNGKWEPIVAFASLTQLCDKNGKKIDKWMGIFHDYEFNVYKTFLTFDDNGNMVWTEPTRVLDSAYRKMEKKYKFCEPEVIRDPNSNEMAMIFRVNAKNAYSHVIFSNDEGETWSKPQELSRELNGERHKAEFDPNTGKLIISFRSINWKVGQEKQPNAWFSRGWLAWVGDYDDLHKGNDAKGDFVLKLAHTYDGDQTAPDTFAHADTGYTGLTIDKAGNVVVTSYGMFSPKSDTEKGGKTYITTKKFSLADITRHFYIKMSE